MPNIELQEISEAYIKADLLFSQSETEQAIQRMACDISEDLHDLNPLCITVLNGGLVTSGKLLTLLNFPLQSSYIHATRYRNTTSGHEIEWKALPDQSLHNRNVLIIDDILDEGITLQAIIDYCIKEGAKTVRTAVLLEKEHNKKAYPNLQATYIGLKVEDRYVFGFGMDYQGYWRNAPGIFALKGK